MNNSRVAVLSVGVLTLVLFGAGPAVQTKDISVYFSPSGGCTDAVVKEIDAAKSELKIQAYSFTSAPIAAAIARAHDRKVNVMAILDDSNEKDSYTGATYLADHQVPVMIDDRHAIAHNKIMIIDRQTVITGSFNFTKQAENANAENMLVMKRPDLAAAYLKNFDVHLGHSREYKRG